MEFLNSAIQAGVGTLALVILLYIMLKVMELLGQGVKARNEDHKEATEFQGRLVTLSEQLGNLITLNTQVTNTTNANVLIILTRLDRVDKVLDNFSDSQKELQKDILDSVHKEISNLKESLTLMLTKNDPIIASQGDKIDQIAKVAQAVQSSQAIQASLAAQASQAAQTTPPSDEITNQNK